MEVPDITMEQIGINSKLFWKENKDLCRWENKIARRNAGVRERE